LGCSPGLVLQLLLGKPSTLALKLLNIIYMSSQPGAPTFTQKKFECLSPFNAGMNNTVWTLDNWDIISC
jgi:hypothetical protein